MLRDTEYDRTTFDRATEEDDSVWPVFSHTDAALEPIPATVDDALPFRSAPAAPDVPTAVGGLLFAAYAALIGALAIATAGPGTSKFMLVIAGFFVVAFFTVPAFVFAQEPREEIRPTLSRFLDEGLMTYTGACGGKAALVQMLVVPLSLAAGILAIALEIALIF